MRRKALSVVIAVLLMGVLGAVGCASPSRDASNKGATGQENSPSGPISVYSREDGSGTRGAFVELFGIIEEDALGEKVDMTTLAAAITNSTSVMMTSIAGDENGIGYISLGSLNDSVKALEIDGIKATAKNVKSGDYKIARPFSIATKDDLSDTGKDFITFIMSAEGQAIVDESGYITVGDAATAYKASEISGRIVVAGSSSVTPVMEKLQEAYSALNPNVRIEIQQSDSTTGINMVNEGTCDIGMASRALKDSEASAGLTATVIAQDGIAVIVNKDSSLNSLTSEQVKNIYTGSSAAWEDVQS